MVITIKDETFTGKVLNELSLEFGNDRMSVKDIIMARVIWEVEDYNTRFPEFYQGLVEPTDAEKTLNGYKLRSRKLIDAEEQAYVALDAFQKNGFFVLVDDVQAESLEQEVILRSDTKISFLKLTPLVGG
ncbi:hypothetical protein [uncultured Pontibacter sp.]|uniref:hypothetical protein n=1 Tax=uncultured Pontibacter sp. TaxID=453356 RepID=UPI0026239EC2|nr:hypothetical protein [uncultured Pontibacter sp.]